MNYLLLNLGMKLYNFCENETFYLELVGGDKNKEFNIRLGWQLESYNFQKFKSGYFTYILQQFLSKHLQLYLNYYHRTLVLIHLVLL